MTQSTGNSLVALPPIHLASFSKWNPDRRDDIYLYNNNVIDRQRHHPQSTNTIDRDNYRYKLTVVDHPRFRIPINKVVSRNTKGGTKGGRRRDEKDHHSHDTATTTASAPSTNQRNNLSFTYTHAIFIIPAGRESEFMFSSMSGLRAIVQSANTARLIAVAMGRNYHPAPTTATTAMNAMISTSTGDMMDAKCDSLQFVQDELRYVIQIIASAISPEVIESTLYMKPNTSVTFYPFLAINGIGRRNIIDSGNTTCSGRYIVEQCMISDATSTDEISLQKWVRRLYFLDGNPYVIQSEVALIQPPPQPRISATATANDQENTNYPWIVDKSVTAFEYHKSLTAGLFAFLTPKGSATTTAPMESYAGLLIGLGGGSLINFWHYLHGDTNEESNYEHRHDRWDITAVELDSSMVDIATNHFGLNLDHPSFSVRIGDGLDVCCIEEDDDATTTMNRIEPCTNVDLPQSNQTTNDGIASASGEISYIESISDSMKCDRNTRLGFPAESFDFIVIDVDSKDIGAGMSCPPASFVSCTYLRTLYTLLQPHHGILAINVAARDRKMFQQACEAVQSVFPTVFLSKRYPNKDISCNQSGKMANADSSYDEDNIDVEPEDLNVVVFAVRTTIKNAIQSLPTLSDMSDRVQRWMEKKSSKGNDENNGDGNITNQVNTMIETDILLKSELCECLEDFIVYQNMELETTDIQNCSHVVKKFANSNKRRNNRRGNTKKR